MKTYWDQVERAAKLRTGEPIYNGSVEHAAVIVERMFAHAEKQLSFLCHGLNPRVYARTETLEQARLFLANKDHKLRILIEMEDTDDLKIHPFFREFGHLPNVTVRQVKPEIRNAYNYHLSVMDDDSYRFESDKEKHVAVAAFGDKVGAANLQGIFDRLWENDTLSVEVDRHKIATKH
jgi:hypothetical protein